MTQRVWHLFAGGYPPDPGGVADYTALLARALVGADREVHVWTQGNDPPVETGGVTVHRVAGRFGPRGLARVGAGLGRFPGPRTVLVQYVPHFYGWKAMNLPFALWVYGRRIWHRDDVRVMFHEVVYPWVRRPVRHNLIAGVTRVMAGLLARAATRLYVSTPAWVPILHGVGARRPFEWLPIPSTVPADPPAAAVAARRAELGGGPIVGHFGTYGPHITPALTVVLRTVLDRRPDIRVLLLGAGATGWRDDLTADRPNWATRVVAPGVLPGEAVAEYLQACDVVVQPYPDGATTRRTTLMAALANGVPVVTTVGDLSEPFWSAGAVAVAPAGDPGRLAEVVHGLLDDPVRRVELGRSGRRLYDDRFAIGRTVEALLADPPQDPRP